MVSDREIFDSFLGSFRNMFVGTTVSLALIGFSSSFEIMGPYVRFIGFINLLMVVYMGYLVYTNFTKRINKLEDVDTAKLWRKWAYMSLIYTISMGFVALVFFVRKVLQVSF